MVVVYWQEEVTAATHLLTCTACGIHLYAGHSSHSPSSTGTETVNIIQSRGTGAVEIREKSLVTSGPYFYILNHSCDSVVCRCLERPIFQGLSQEVLSACLESKLYIGCVQMPGEAYIPGPFPGGSLSLSGVYTIRYRILVVCRCLERPIFQGLSQEVLSACLESIQSAAQGRGRYSAQNIIRIT